MYTIIDTHKLQTKKLTYENKKDAEDAYWLNEGFHGTLRQLILPNGRVRMSRQLHIMGAK